MSKWTVENVGDNTCRVTIEEVTEEESGEWNCDMQSYPNGGGKYESAQEFTTLHMIEPALVELRGPLELVVFEGEKVEFNCKASAVPLPERMEWTIDRREIEGLAVESSSDDGRIMDQSISAKVETSWDGKEITCTAVQVDDEGNEVESSDHRTIRVEKARSLGRPDENIPMQRAGEFKISDRYPNGVSGEYPEMLMTPGAPVTFQCTSTLEWNVCRWKRPNSDKPCGIFSEDFDKSCNSGWSTSAGGEGWTVKKVSENECSITGVISDMDQGEWNCELQSKPILNEHNVYENDQQYFKLIAIQAARVQHDLPPEMDLTEGEDFDITINIREAYPPPEILYFLNSKTVKLQLIEKSNPTTDSEGRVSYHQTVRYSAKAEDSGKQLIIVTRQTDAEQNEVDEQIDIYLNIQAPPPPPQKQSMGAGIIAAIVAVACFLLLAIILLIVAFRTGKLCFKEKKREHGNIEIQTEDVMRSDAGISAAFGPDKPNRAHATMQGEAALLMEDETEEPGNKFAADETRAYKDEGIGDDAVSLHSLDTDVNERDWKDTLMTLGPKFEFLQEQMRGGDDGDSDEDEDQEEDVKDKNQNLTVASKVQKYEEDEV